MADDTTPRRPTTHQPTHAPGEPAPVRNPTEARQGAPAGRMRWVLVIGMVAVSIAFVLAYLGTAP